MMRLIIGRSRSPMWFLVKPIRSGEKEADSKTCVYSTAAGFYTPLCYFMVKWDYEERTDA